MNLQTCSRVWLCQVMQEITCLYPGEMLSSSECGVSYTRALNNRFQILFLCFRQFLLFVNRCSPCAAVGVKEVAHQFEASLAQSDRELGVLESDQVEKDLSGGSFQLLRDFEDFDKVGDLFDHSRRLLLPALLVKKTFSLLDSRINLQFCTSKI